MQSIHIGFLTLASIVHRRFARVVAIDGPTPKVQLSIGLGCDRAPKGKTEDATDR